MSWVVAVFVVLLLLGLIAFCVINALRLKRHLNKSLNTFRTRLEEDANAVLDGLLNQVEDRPPRSANGSQSTASD